MQRRQISEKNIRAIQNWSLSAVQEEVSGAAALAAHELGARRARLALLSSIRPEWVSPKWVSPFLAPLEAPLKVKN